VNLDGFEPEYKNAYAGYSEGVADETFLQIDRLARWLHVEVHGVAKLPTGRALLVANHAFGWDVVFAMAAIRRATERTVWALGEHVWWEFPGVRRLAAAVGTVDGTAENADCLLSADELVLVLPGGLREAVKPRELRYRLLWGHRYGFVRAAIRNQAPIVPLVSFGFDELFDFVGNAYERGQRWLHRGGFPIPLPSRLLPIPHRARLRFLVGDPIPTRFAPAAEKDLSSVRSLRREVEGAMHEMLELDLARRVGIDLS
jgi:1-acyl-sn-glycerol-3-phosphate acyltransferase